MDNNQYAKLIQNSKFFNTINKVTHAGEKLSPVVKLNIGSGPNIFPYDGWINYDREDIAEYLHYLSDPKPDSIPCMPEHQKTLYNYLKNGGKSNFHVRDLSDGFPQHPDNTVDCIYLGQMIEHLNPIAQVPKFLEECNRMLKPGGVIRITTPDLDLLIQAYLNNDMDKFAIEQPEYYNKKYADPSLQLAYIMYGATGPNCKWNNYEGHMCLYTKKSISHMLRNTGFKDIEFYYETGKSKSPIMQKEAVDAGMSHSFITEATK